MYPQHAQRGFTLVEMVVTVGIFAIISTLVIVRNAQFDNETLLHTLAYDIALSVRQAQQFGINVRASEGMFDEPYGVHFDADSPNYFMFTDNDGDGLCDNDCGQGSTEVLETYTLGRGATIAEICNLNNEECDYDLVDVIFRRPNPDAIIDNGSMTRVSLELVSARQQGTRLIIIESTGQISIQRPPTPEEE